MYLRVGLLLAITGCIPAMHHATHVSEGMHLEMSSSLHLAKRLPEDSSARMLAMPGMATMFSFERRRFGEEGPGERFALGASLGGILFDLYSELASNGSRFDRGVGLRGQSGYPNLITPYLQIGMRDVEGSTIEMSQALGVWQYSGQQGLVWLPTIAYSRQLSSTRQATTFITGVVGGPNRIFEVLDVGRTFLFVGATLSYQFRPVTSKPYFPPRPPRR